jgi:cephalosporin-C deacetylase-like acetyl esterase
MNEAITTNIEFICHETGTLLRGRFIIPNHTNKRIPVVIMLTGDGPKGTKSLSWVNIPPKLSEFGIATFLFDFEGLGYSEGDRKTLTLTKGIANFNSAFNYLKSIEWIDETRIAIFASSFGANAALLCPKIVNSCKVIGLKSPSCFLPDAYMNEVGLSKFEKWFSDGFLADNGYDIEVLTDCFKYNTYEIVEQITIPCLITHGTNDEVVPISQSIYLYNLLNGEKRFEKFIGVGHGYSEDNAWEKMATIFVNWFNDKLK